MARTPAPPPEPVSPATGPDRPVGDFTGARPRARRTYAKLTAAARVVFEDRGFLEARIADIAKQAAVAHGTFYTYFDSKEEIFLAVAQESVQDILSRGLPETPSDADPVASIRAAASSIVSGYQDHVGILESLSVVASFDERAKGLREHLTSELISQADRVIRGYQRAGVAPKNLDRAALATALGAMAESFPHVSLVRHKSLSRDQVVDTLTYIWVKSLGIESKSGHKPKS
jgi:AcrR family transcriptional regulator